MRSPRRAFLELCRVFLVPTAVADSLAGFALASALFRPELHPRVLLILPLASMLLYAFGMVANDLFDRERDRALAPSKPLPSGRVSSRAAAVFAALLGGGGLGLAALVDGFVPAAAVVVLALAYDAGGKRLPVLGNALMGGCRAANWLLGAAAAGHPEALADDRILTGAAIIGVYIAGVTAVSLLEERPTARRTLTALLLAFPLGSLVVPLLAPTSPAAWAGWAVLEVALLRAVRAALRPPPGVPPAAVFVRSALGAVFLVDAAALWALAPSTRAVLVPGLGLYLLAVLAWWWKRRWLRSGGADT